MNKDFANTNIDEIMNGKLSIDDLDGVAGGDFTDEIWILTDEERALFDGEELGEFRPEDIAAFIRFYKHGVGVVRCEQIMDPNLEQNKGDLRVKLVNKYWDMF